MLFVIFYHLYSVILYNREYKYVLNIKVTDKPIGFVLP